jgi:hypothetical protein
MLLPSASALADAPAVPGELQAALVSKVSRYDRNFRARAGGLVRVAIVLKRGSARSEASAMVMKEAFGSLDDFGGLPHQVSVLPYDSAEMLVKHVRDQRLSVIYVTPTFDSEVGRIRAAMAGLDVLTVGATEEYVREGVVLGFELASGKPKMLLNLAQAKRQNVDFKVDVLKLMKVVAR